MNGFKPKDTYYDECDDNMWHEQSLSYKMLAEQKLEEYRRSFSVHALTRVFRAKRLESLFWVGMLIGGLLLSSIVCFGLIRKFLARDVYTEIKSVVTNKNYFPSITFCEKSLLMDSYFAFCGIPPKEMRSAQTNGTCTNRNNTKEANITSHESLWSNGVFSVTNCFTWGGKKCLGPEYFKSKQQLNNSCIIWNYRGDLYDVYSHTEISFKFNKPDWLKGRPKIFAIPHHHELEEIDLTTKIDMQANKHYQINIDKTIIKRLEYPFSTECVNKKDGDIFPGEYSRRSCIESGKFIEMYKKCGDVLDYVRDYIPKDIVKNYSRTNKTIKEQFHCIMTFGRAETKPMNECKFACHDIDLGIMSTFQDLDNVETEDNLFKVSIQHMRVDTYKVYEEKELYSWDQMASEIGGFLGLLMGASFISFVELFVYIMLNIFQRLL